MPAYRKTPGEYSTNPHTVKARKARQRRMNLSAEQLVEQAAKQADYKAMLNARSKVREDPNFARATESQKAAMLEKAMRHTMEQRRSRGQDTMSKMAAFKAGVYRDHGPGPATRVPITKFLRNNGYSPSLTNGAHHRGATANSRNTGHEEGLASWDDMEAAESAFADDESFTPIGRPASIAARLARRNANLLESQSPFSPPPYDAKGARGSLARMTPEPMLSTIEGDVPMTDAGESLTQLRFEMRHLRTLCDNAAESNRKMETELRIERDHAQELEARFNQLENMVHALQHTSLGSIVERIKELESIVGDLQGKVGSGCDAEIAKMREVMGGLKSSLDKVGGFV